MNLGSRHKACVLTLISFCFFWWSCGEHRIYRGTPNPILLLHGLGGKADSWSDAGLRDFLEGQGLRYGGVLRLNQKGRVEIQGGSASAEKCDFFHVEISDPLAGLALWSRELKSLIGAVRRTHGGAPVVLVGFSAGGLAGRKYLIDHPSDHGVAKLLTIAAPHRGSELALVADKLRALNAGSSGGFVQAVLRGGLRRFEQTAGVPLDAPLIQELLPEDHNPTLAELNRSVHPAGVEYACLVAVGSPGFEGWGDFEQDLGRLRSGQFKESILFEKLATKGLGLLSVRGGWLLGDGAVLADSQDLRNVEFFQHNQGLVRGCPSVEASHQGSRERYQAVLESIASPARFLAARTAAGSSGTRARLEVDFHHYLAALTKVSARNAADRSPLPVSPPALFQRAEESFGRVTVGPFDPSQVTAVEVLWTDRSRVTRKASGSSSALKELSQNSRHRQSRSR